MSFKDKNAELGNKKLKVQKLMKENEQDNFINMIRRNEFTKFKEDKDNKQLEFDMEYKDPVILK